MERPVIVETLGLLPEPGRRSISFIQSVCVNVGVGLLLLWLSTHLHQAVPAPTYISTELIFPARTPVPPPALHLRVPLPPPVASLRRLATTRHNIEPPKPEEVRLKAPAMPVIPSSPARAVLAAPQVKVGSFLTPKPAPQAEHRNVAVIKSGGFGDPQGVAVNPNAAQRATIAAVGSFENASGINRGAGATRAGGVKAGEFGSGVNGTGQAAAGQGTGHGTVATGGFGGNGFSSGTAPGPRMQEASFTPPKVRSEPHPQYTEEAMRLKIQGEITLQVRFGTDGKVEVLRVVSGLGHGLDEEAERIAQLIRFTPAIKNGQPVEDITYIHILFQLA
jgi:TonB family protein